MQFFAFKKYAMDLVRTRAEQFLSTLVAGRPQKQWYGSAARLLMSPSSFA